MAVPQTFKAAIVPALGGAITVVDRSLSPLAPDEVAVKITASAINPVDWKIRDRGLIVQRWPVVLGSDAAGEVAAVGADVSGFAPGDRVFFQGIIGADDSATFQQYAKIAAPLLAKTPAGISDDEAAGVALAAIAGVTGFYHSTGAGLPAPWDGGGAEGKGRAVLVIGGSSSVGLYAIQLARLSGFTRIITNSSPAHAERARDLGAHVVLDRATQSTPEAVRDAAAGLPLTLVFDAISSHETQLLAVQTLQLVGAADGRVVTVTKVDEEALALAKGSEPAVEIRYVLGVGSRPDVRPLSEGFLRAVGGDDGWLASRQFVPNVVEVVPGGLASVGTAVDKNKRGVSGVKLVVRPHEV